MHNELIARLFLQIVVILLTCQIVVYFGERYFKQTPVVCEMIAGVLLGPSLLGFLTPEIKEWLFPSAVMALDNGQLLNHPSMIILYSLGQIGLVLYMFIMGLTFEEHFIIHKIKKVCVISSSGIIGPFLLGMGAALFLYSEPDLFCPNIGVYIAALYLGTAISITAFPTLARILQANNIAKTSFGTLVLAAGSAGDALAWCILAIVLSCVKHNPSIGFAAVIGGVLYVLFQLTVTKKILAKMNFNNQVEGRLTLFYILIFLMLSAWFADAIGIHAIFGSFVMGVIVPRGKFANELHNKIEPLTTSFLLPIFFVYSGLNTNINLLNSLHYWIIALFIIIISVFGKGLFCTLSARTTGEHWRESMAIGVLMNCRGLMELIILNIGLECKIITPRFFSIVVLMAIITTLMTSPLFNFIYLKGRDKS
jgi:Kef-type K+ transport system membrane component KefB